MNSSSLGPSALARIQSLHDPPSRIRPCDLAPFRLLSAAVRRTRPWPITTALPPPPVRPSHCLAASPLVVAPTMSASPASNTDTGELLAPPPPPPKPTQQNPAQQQAKRKASAAGMDNHGTGRSVKRRASKACQCCRARKVRCNVTEHGAPCTNCRLDEVECIVSESRRKKSVPPARPATAKALVGRMSSLLSAIFFSFPLCAIEMEKTGARG